VKRNDLYYFRRAEIVTIARRKGVADTDDLHRFLVAWFWHRPLSADHDPNRSLIGVASRMGRDSFMLAEAKEIIEASKRGRPLHKADDLGLYLRLTDAERTAWGIRTIGGHDFSRRQRSTRRKRLERERKARRRREAGAKPQSLSQERDRPWVKDGVSRREWFRRKARARSGTVGTVSSARDGTVSAAVPYFLSKDEIVPITTRTRPSQVLRGEIMPTDWLTALGIPVPAERKRSGEEGRKQARGGDQPCGTRAGWL
jgi:hypothetical protein